MRSDLSPKELAEVIGVSESSVKRWVDEGKLTGSRTAGGHRRVPLHEALRFIRATNQPLQSPDLLGIADLSSDCLGIVTSDDADDALLHALDHGEADRARGLIMAYHLRARCLSSVCDGPIAYALHRLADMRAATDRPTSSNHIAAEICHAAIQQIRQTLRPHDAHAPTALGAAPEGDPDTLTTAMAAITLQECGYRDIDLGSGVPLDVLRDAIEEHKPSLVWLCFSTEQTRARHWAAIAKLAEVAQQAGARTVVCGRMTVVHAPPDRAPFSIVVSWAEFATLARALRSAARRTQHAATSKAR